MHQFLIRGKPYGVWKPGGISFCDNPHQVRLCDFHFRCKERWVYEYDLTDWWQHEIRLEQVLPLDKALRYPICLAGKRRAPLENCGGPRAFMELQDEHPLWKVLPQFAQCCLTTATIWTTIEMSFGSWPTGWSVRTSIGKQ